MYIKQNIYKFLFIFSIVIVFMASSCSKPAEDKTMPAKQISETTQAEKIKVETPAPVVAKTEKPIPETSKPVTEPEPVVPKPVAPEPVKPEPVKPEPVKPKPAIASGLTDVITMENPAYKKHKKGIVLFTHKKHAKEHKIGCGQCHHDKEGKPLNDLKDNDKVDACIACHTKPGQAPRPKDKTKKLSKKEKREYHAEAIHENCIACHKEHNKKNNTKAAPSSCSKCHPKGK